VYHSEFEFTFENKVGFESDNYVSTFDEKIRGKKSHASVPLTWHVG
jgi:hypothetical protein